MCMCVCSDILSNMSLTPVMCLIESDEEDTCSGEERSSKGYYLILSVTI